MTRVDEPRVGSGQARPLRAALALALVAAAYAASRRDFGPDGFALPLLAWTLLALGLVPAFVHLSTLARSPARARPLPFLPALGAVYAVYFALPVLLRDRVEFMTLAPRPALVEEALGLALAGWVALLVAYYGLGPRLVRPRPLALEWRPARARAMAPFLLAGGLAAAAAQEFGSVPGSVRQIVVLVGLLLPVGVGVFVLLAARGELSRPGRWLTYGGLVPLYLALQLPGGAVALLVFAGLFVLMLLWGAHRRVPWAIVVPAMLALVLVKGNLDEFRSLVNHTRVGEELTATERGELITALAVESVELRGTEALADAGEFLLQRTSQIALFAHAVERTPAFVPYQEGATYRTLPASFVPRFLWPDKPTKELGQWFGHTYGVIHPSDRSTAVNLPQVVELYANFGLVGVVLGMALLGLLYRWLDGWLNAPGVGDAALLAGAVLFSRLVNLESDASLVLGGALQTGVVLWLVLRLLCGARARAAAAVPSPASGA